MRRKRYLPLLFALLTALTLHGLLPVSAADVASPAMDEATAAVLYHVESGITVTSKNADLTVSAGSSVKIMSGLLACEALGGRMNDRVHISQDMIQGVSGYRLNIEAGDTLSVEQLLYAALCGSYNDAYYILGYLCAGSVSAFVEQMNARAREMGLSNTVFTDPSGVDDNSRTTANELLQIALSAARNTTYMTVACAQKYQMAATDRLSARTINNRNALVSSASTTLYFNKNCRGMSAGSTARAGQCVVTMAQNGNESYLCVILGGMESEDISYGYVVANRLIDWVNKTYTYLEVASPETVVCTLPVSVSNATGGVEISPRESLYCYLPAGVEVGKEIKYSVRLLYSELEAPVSEGMMVGYLSVIYQGKVLGTTPLYTATSAERSSFISRLANIKELTGNRATRAGILFFAVGLTVWVVTEYAVARHRRKKWDKYFSGKMDLSPDQLRKNRK